MTVTMSAPAEVRRARFAVSAVFAVHGAVSGSFATRVPWIADHAHVGPGSLGLALLTPAIGAVVATPFGGRLVHRYRSRTVIRLLLAGWCVALVLPALAPGLVTLAFTLLVFGATGGLADMAMNAQGAIVEQRLGRSIMSGLHGLWSLGGLVAGGAGALAAHAALDARIHFGLASLVLLVVGTVAGQWLLDIRPAPEADRPPAFALPSRAVLVLGLVGFCAVFAESASADWAALYLRTVTRTDLGVAAAAYTGFACAMAAGRFIGDPVVRRLGHVRTVRLAGLVGTTGGVLVVIARVPPVGIAGFALIGIGVSVVVPLAFAAAGSFGPHPGHDIAGVATISYGAGMVAPAIIGGIAAASSLSVSFCVVTALVAVVALTARTFRPRGRADG